MEDFETKFRNGKNYPKVFNDVIDFIREKNLPVKSFTLENALGIKGQVVRDCVRFARRQGILIVSSSKGYKLSNDRTEIIETIHALQNRITSLQKTAMIMMNVLDSMPSAEEPVLDLDSLFE